MPSAHNRDNKNVPDGSHGLKFETKLLGLFCIRGLCAGYKFELGKEKEDLGGKFDDVIFRYEVPDELGTGKHWRYLYLQAKHKENENGGKITAKDLLDPKPKRPFSLGKYFLSYCKMRVRGDDVRDCIVCSNWDVDKNEFKKIQLEEVKEQHDILKFVPGEKTVSIYKLKIDENLRSETIKFLIASDIVTMGITNKFCDDTLKVQFMDEEATNSNEDEVLTLDLSKENIADSKTKKFRHDFMISKKLSAVANKFRQKIQAVIDDFYSKLVLVVNMPNETQFKKIIETEDVSKYYPSDKCENQTTLILQGISDAFEKKPANFWLTSEEAKKILLADVTDISIKYQRQLEEQVGFHGDAIKVMENKLRRVVDSSGRKKVERISTPSPKHTAVKVISAIQILTREFKQEGNYLVTQWSHLQHDDEMKRWGNIFKLQKEFHYFFVFVCDDEASVQHFENFISVNEADEKNIIVFIEFNQSSAAMEEEIKYTDLSKDSQEAILTKTVGFQGKDVTVRDLVGDKPEEVIDYISTKELLFEKNKVEIPSFSMSNFEQCLYVKRGLRFPFENQFELSGECRISRDGHIEWLVEEKRQKEIWEKIIKDITNQASSTVIEDDLTHLKENGNKRSVVIISGVAGTGKSTLLCHYYKEIKRVNPNHWVIKINLLDYEAILKQDNKLLNAVDIVNLENVVDKKSSFSRSLLRNRLERGDRIIFMFDGFDEVNNLCQKRAIQLMKAISKNKSIQLYVTTRPHVLEDLQFQLSQLAYTLENFTEKDQIDYLASYWKKKLNLSGENEDSLQQLSESLVKGVSQTLKDEDKSFVGVPLQCRILAECFQSNIKDLITQNCVEDNEEPREIVKNKITDLLKGQKFDLVSLFDRLMDTKRKIFCEEKVYATNTNQILEDAIKRLIKDIKDHLTQLAIKTLVTDQEMIDILLPPQSLHRSDKDIAKGENIIVSNGLKFGLTFRSEEKSPIQFLHRTYAEYLFARYLYKGFLLDDERHNKLLENALSRKLILNKILAVKQYDGVQIFFNSMLKKLVDNDEEGRKRIVKGNLPERLKKFTENLQTQVFRHKTITKFRNDLVKRSDLAVNALHFSLATGNGMIFKFLCDCLDATFDNRQVHQVMMISFTDLDISRHFSLEFFRNKESQLFKRFIDYFNSNEAASAILKCMHGLPPSGLKYSQWNGKENPEVVHYLLQFMDSHREELDEHFLSNRQIHVPLMLTFFIFNENYDSHLKIFLELLSQSRTYSDDTKFANLLKEAFCSKEHFVAGRIEKVLISLGELKRQKLLTQLYGIVLAIEPQAFQNIYQPPHLLMGRDAISAEIKNFLKPDPYRMTGLHRAAFHGDAELIKETLEKIQENEIKVITLDEYGFTPFYVAAVRDQDKIYGNMLAFLKANLSIDVLKEHLMDTKGFIHNSLLDAIKSENTQIVKLILNAIRRELGQNYVIDLLKTNDTTGSSTTSSSFIVQCETKELINAIAKIVVMRDDNVKDYTDLYDLVFHDDSTINTLKFIDGENLQGLLLLKGVEDFTKRVLNKYVMMISNAFRLMSNHLLQHFNEDQLGQFVKTITSKENSNGTTDIYADHLEPGTSYWGTFIHSALIYQYETYFVLREDAHCIFECLKCVGDNSAKNLLLQKECNDFIMIQSSQQIVQLMLTHLSQNSQQEVKRQWENNAPPIKKFLPLTSVEKKIGSARYCSAILQFYLNYGSDVHLKEFVKVVTMLHNIDGLQFSVWSRIFENCDKETNEILKLVSEKVEILGRGAVKKLMLHEIDQIPFIIKAVSWGEDVDARLEILPTEIKEEIKEEIQIFIQQNAPKFIDNALRDLKAFLKNFDTRHYKKLNSFTFFLNHSDKSQQEQLVQNITSVTNGENKRSVWAELLTNECEDHKTDDIAKMDKFMNCLSEKLGSNAVKELVLHNDGEMRVIFYPALRGEEKMLETMLNYLSAKDRKEVQRQVNEFLDETFQD